MRSTFPWAARWFIDSCLAIHPGFSVGTGITADAWSGVGRGVEEGLPVTLVPGLEAAGEFDAFVASCARIGPERLSRVRSKRDNFISKEWNARPILASHLATPITRFCPCLKK